MSAPTQVVVRSLTRPDVDDRMSTITVDSSGRVSVGADGPFEVATIAPGVYRVMQNGRSWLVYVAGDMERRWVFVDGEVHEVQITGERSRRARRGAHQDALTSPMPATVMKILVRPGEIVHAGDTLLVLEAMKMELPVRAPRDGTVKVLRCQEGDLVQPSVALLELA